MGMRFNASKGKLFIKKYQYNNEQNENAHGKWFGRIVHVGTVGTDGLAEHIMEHGTVYTDDVVVGLTRKLMHCIREMLEEGYKVKLDGIGTLYLSAKSIGVENAGDFSADRHIKSLRVRFLADQSAGSMYSKKGLQNVRLTTDLSAFTGVTEEESGGSSSGSGGSGTVNDQP